MLWKFEKAKELIKERGRTTEWVAERCGIEVTSLRNILRGDKPSLPVIKLMALALDCAESELFDKEDPGRKRA
jgi:transcriptional regulator with XRE-family HTH domain